LKNIHVKEKIPLEKLPALQDSIQKKEQKLGKGGRILFRYSGTESVVRIMVEGPSIDLIENLADELCTETQTAMAAFQGTAR